MPAPGMQMAPSVPPPPNAFACRRDFRLTCGPVSANSCNPILGGQVRPSSAEMNVRFLREFEI
jgi:hypothetical protein